MTSNANPQYHQQQQRKDIGEDHFRKKEVGMKNTVYERTKEIRKSIGMNMDQVEKMKK